MRFIGKTFDFIVLALFVGTWLAFACTTGTNGDTEIGGPNLNPDPEDIFDLPNPLPDSFLGVSCPIGDDFVQVQDLEIVIASPNAPSHDFDRDGDVDSILLVRGDPHPKTIIFRINSLFENLSYTSVDQSVVLPAFFHGGWELNENLANPYPGTSEITQSFSSEILPLPGQPPPGAWTNTGHNPIVEQFSVPGEVLFNPAFPNHESVCPSGWEGEWAPCDPAPVGGPGALYDKPGVHVVAAHIFETDGTLHCTRYVWRILICPVACHCDAQGNPLNNRNCRP